MKKGQVMDANEYHIRYTATLVVPDGSDTDGYGQPCLEGFGYEIVNGWLNPQWSLFSVDDERPAEPHDIIDQDDIAEWVGNGGGHVEDLIRERVSDVIGYIDHETGDGTYYGGTEHVEHRTGITSIIAAHVEAVPYKEEIST